MDPINHTAGAGFATKDTTASIRVTDNASTLQAETVAIMEALTHASLREGHVVIQEQLLTAYSIACPQITSTS